MKKIHIVILMLLGGLSFLSNSGHSQTLMFVDKKIADDREAFDRLGASGAVSIDGNWAVVGSSYHNELDTIGGSVYLYEYIPSACQWIQRDEIFPEIAEGVTDADEFDFFGRAVSIFGNLIAVGAHNDKNNGPDGTGPMVDGGIVYLYEIVGTNAVFKQRIFAYNDLGLEDQFTSDAFGSSVHLSATHLIVGDETDAENEDGTPFGANKGAAFIYEWTGTSFVFQDKIISNAPEADDRFGFSVAIEGDYAAVGAPYGGPGAIGVGKVEIFQWDAGLSEWVHQNTFFGVVDILGDDWDVFGSSLDLSSDKLIVGAQQDFYDEAGTDPLTWAGSVFIYELSAGVWSFQQKIVPIVRTGGMRFGADVAISDDNRVIVGSPSVGSGSAYIFEEILGIWTETEIISSVPVDGTSGDLFGHGVDINGDEIIISAPYEEHDEDYGGAPVTLAGSVYFYTSEIIADTPNLLAENPVCTPGAEVTISVVGGDLNDASYWEWYEGDCGSEPIGTGDAIIVTVDGPTTICARGVGQCDWFEKGDCGCITLDLEDGYWHKQTVDGIRDHGNDIITDAAGNVYMVGLYNNYTTFLGSASSDVTASSGEFEAKSYLVKYDNCGNLMWVAYANGSLAPDSDFANSVTLDELNGYVYVGGNFYNEINFNSGVGDFGIGPFPSAGLSVGTYTKGYVARFNIDNGMLDFIDTVDVNVNTEVSALTINKSTGELFVGGQAGLLGSDDKIYVRKYYPTITGLGTPFWHVAGYDEDRENLADMAYDEISSSLWLIGDYSNTFSLLGGPTITTANIDAFVAKINDGFTPSLGGLKGGNTSNFMWGNGISVNSITGNVYLTGSYEGYSSNLFGTGQTLGMLYSTGRHAYFMAMDNSMNPLWAAPKWSAAFTGTTEGLDVAFNEDGYACFVGTYTHAALNFSLGTTLPYVVAWPSGGTRPHIFAVSYDDLTGAFNWNNATMDPIDNTGSHLATAVAADPFGNSFISGGFRNAMGYLSGLPSSGNLFTPTSSASFTMRVQSSTGGAMQMPGSGTVEGDDVISHFESVSSSSEFEITTYPNPVNDLVNVRIAGFDANENGRLTVLNLDGKVVTDVQLKAGQTDLDFSNLDAGVYLIQVVNGSKTAVQRVVKS